MNELPPMPLWQGIIWIGMIVFIAAWLTHAWLKTKNFVVKYTALYFIFKTIAMTLMVIPPILASSNVLARFYNIGRVSLLAGVSLMNAITVFWVLMLFSFTYTHLRRQALVVTIILLLPFIIYPLFAPLSYSATPEGGIRLDEIGLLFWALLIPHLLFMAPLGFYFLRQAKNSSDKNIKIRAGLIGSGLILAGVGGPFTFGALPLSIKYITLMTSQGAHFLILAGVLYKVIAGAGRRLFQYREKPIYISSSK